MEFNGKRYTINCTVSTFEPLSIEGLDISKITQSIVSVVLDKNTNDKLHMYYNTIRELILNRNRVIAILVGEESNIRKSICNLLASYHCYDIYEVDSLNKINKEYLETVIARTPGLSEVQNFISSEITAYADLNVIMLGIKNLIGIGDIEGLTRFVESHIPSMCSFAETIDYLKQVADNSNSGEAQGHLQELQQKLNSVQAELAKETSKLQAANAENDRLVSDMRRVQEEIGNLKNKLADLEDASSSGEQTQVIRIYSTIKTNLIQCKAKSILYFKEISPIPYMGTFVSMVFEILKLKKKTVKLLIYDNKQGFNVVYKPLPVIGGSEYQAGRDSYIKKTERFVVVEPMNAILTDILTSMYPEFDVVIIFDRLRQIEDLVTGNNVFKFYIANSQNDLTKVNSFLKIADKSSVFVRDEMNANGEYLSIPRIADWGPSTTSSARIQKYRKLTCGGSKNIGIFDTVTKKARIDSL